MADGLTAGAAFLGEAQLLGWSESHNAGARLVLALPDAGDLAPFRAMTVRKGKVAGQRLACVLVEMGDDETEPLAALMRALNVGIDESAPQEAAASSDQHDAAPPQRARGGPLCRLAGMWCRDAGFCAWLAQQRESDWIATALKVGPDDICLVAAEAVRTACGVASRAQLDHEPVAAAKFHDLIRRPYSAHVEQRQAAT